MGCMNSTGGARFRVTKLWKSEAASPFDDMQSEQFLESASTEIQAELRSKYDLRCLKRWSANED